MTVRSAWLLLGGDQPGQTREDTRLAPIGTYTPEDEIRARSGVIPGGDPFAATGAGAMSLQIGGGRAIVQGTDAQGAYPIAVDAPETVTFADGDAQFTRVDSVILRVYDGLFDDSGQTVATVEVIQGQVTDTPTAPTLPPCSLRLWDVTVPAGASAGVGGIDWNSSLTDRRRYTAAVGGIIPRGVTSDAGAYDGQYTDMGGTLYRWSAADGEWLPYRPPELPVEIITAGVDTAAGWALVDYAARRQGRVVQMLGSWQRTGADIPANPNLVDTVIATLPAGWRPTLGLEALASNGYGHGAVTIGSDGILRLRTWAGGLTKEAVEQGETVRVAATWLQ